MSKQIFSQNRCTLLTNPLEKLVIFFNFLCFGFSIHEKFHGEKATEQYSYRGKKKKRKYILIARNYQLWESKLLLRLSPMTNT